MKRSKRYQPKTIKPHWLILGLFISIQPGWLLSASAKTSSKESDSGWHLRQKHEDAGEFDAYIMPDAIKVYCERQKWFLISTAPFQSVTFFSTEEKKICSIPLEKFRSTMLVSPFVASLGTSRLEDTKQFREQEQIDNTLKQQGSGVMFGIPYNEYVGHNRNSYRIIKTDAIKANPKCAEVIARLAGIPHPVHIQDIPLGYRVDIRPGKKQLQPPQSIDVIAERKRDAGDLRTGEHIKLSTLSIDRARLKKNDFQIPGGYRPVSDLTQITFSKKTQIELTNTLDQLGFTDDKVSRRSSSSTIGAPMPHAKSQ